MKKSKGMPTPPSVVPPLPTPTVHRAPGHLGAPKPFKPFMDTETAAHEGGESPAKEQREDKGYGPD